MMVVLQIIYQIHRKASFSSVLFSWKAALMIAEHMLTTF